MYPKTVWILTILCLIFIARKTIFNVARETGDYSTTIDSSTSLAMIGIFCSILYFLSHFKAFQNSSKKMWSILIYYLFAWSSILWAGNHVTISFKVLENICNILLVGAIVYNIKDSKKLMFFIILFATASTYIDLLGYYIRTGFRWYHTNVYTITALIGILLSIGCIKNRLFTFRELALPLALCTYAWISGTSVASYISAIIGGFILYSSSKKGINLTRTILTCICIYAIYILAEDQIMSFMFDGRDMDTIKSGTGRDFLWAAAYKLWQKSPLLGHGFIIGETGLGNTRQISAHNSFISTLINTGFIGFLIFCGFIYKWCKESFKTSFYNIYASITFPVIIAICININSCPVLASHWSYVTDSVLLIIAATFITFRNKDNGDSRTLKQLSKN